MVKGVASCDDVLPRRKPLRKGMTVVRTVLTASLLLILLLRATPVTAAALLVGTARADITPPRADRARRPVRSAHLAKGRHAAYGQRIGARFARKWPLAGRRRHGLVRPDHHQRSPGGRSARRRAASPAGARSPEDRAQRHAYPHRAAHPAERIRHSQDGRHAGGRVLPLCRRADRRGDREGMEGASVGQLDLGLGTCRRGAKPPRCLCRRPRRTGRQHRSARIPRPRSG